MNLTTDNPMIRLLNGAANLIILNILWVICSLPIVTIGASTTALYSIILKMVRDEEGYILKGYLRAFRENFRKSTIMWLIFLAAAIFILTDYLLAIQQQGSVNSILQILFLVFAVLLMGMGIYAFSLQARYENSIRNTLKNAWILLFAALPSSIIMLILTVGSIVLTFRSEKAMLFGAVFWVFFGVSLVTWLNALLLRRIFDTLEQEKALENHEENVDTDIGKEEKDE